MTVVNEFFKMVLEELATFQSERVNAGYKWLYIYLFYWELFPQECYLAVSAFGFWYHLVTMSQWQNNFQSFEQYRLFMSSVFLYFNKV